ncbi:hypothetical protein LCGC14_1131820 [marine sediment metagenome]|uniref:Leucine-rich repeat domain-containing protein n=1 Tax=marine sediment metagenome TaxID=412755 RepID=A0A0F9PJ35_9ZZZZ
MNFSKNENLKKITDIKGLKELDYIKYLGLADNNIEKIEG